MEKDGSVSYHDDLDIMRVKHYILNVLVEPSYWDSLVERDNQADLSEWVLDSEFCSRFTAFTRRLRAYCISPERREIALFVEMWMSSRHGSVAYTLLVPPLRK